MRISNKILLSLVAFSLVYSIAAAANTTQSLPMLNANETLGIGFAFQALQCKTNFSVGFANMVWGYVPNGVLSNAVSGVDSVTSQLQGFAVSSNSKSYMDALQNSYNPALGNLDQAVKSSLKESNLSSNAISELKTYYNASMASYKKCAAAPLSNYYDLKVNNFKDDIAQFTQQDQVLANDGVNISALNLLLNNATVTIIVPLQNTLSGATNESQINAALQQYCLLDGCANGINFHLDAKMAIARLNLITELVLTTNATNGTVADQILAEISNSTRMLYGQVGTKKYAGNQSIYIWSNIYNAQSLLKTLHIHPVNVTSLINRYQSQISIYNGQIKTLQAKGVNTTTMSALISSANATIIVPLEGNPSAQAAFEYCLFNGCKNGMNFHLDAYFNLDKLTAVLQKLDSATSVNLTLSDEVQADLNNATQILAAVGSRTYTNTQNSTLASNLTNAAKLLESPQRILYNSTSNLQAKPCAAQGSNATNSTGNSTRVGCAVRRTSARANHPYNTTNIPQRRPPMPPSTKLTNGLETPMADVPTSSNGSAVSTANKVT